MDVRQIEREYRRILNSRKSLPQKEAMADRLFQKINEAYASLIDERARLQFREEYRAAAETKFAPTTQGSLVERFLDHARTLKEAEAVGEKLKRELGDF
jgi:DnaJ-class molecular chaperone